MRGTDISEISEVFARTIQHQKVDGVILFPLARPKTLVSWIEALSRMDISVSIKGFTSEFIIEKTALLKFINWQQGRVF